MAVKQPAVRRYRQITTGSLAGERAKQEAKSWVECQVILDFILVCSMKRPQWKSQFLSELKIQINGSSSSPPESCLDKQQIIHSGCN